MGVRIIPAQMATPVTQTKDEQQRNLIRVAAYCRVSTELEEQESSFEAQVSHYTEYINANPNWKLAGIYADEGLSGTGTKKRERFNAMIKDCEDGKIDMVITKSISRFARNTLDCLQYIRKLKALNIPILFEKENINTMDSSGELLITIMASIAQQESASISQNVRMGHQYRFQQGKPLTRGGFLGYRMSDDKSYLEINPDEAVLVRRIYREFLEGKSANGIAKELTAEGVKSPTGKDQWHCSCIISMLKNEKYRGDLLLQKYYVKDFLTKQRVKNNGKYPKYYVENAHEPIVPKEVALRIQGELLRRDQKRAVTGSRSGQFEYNFSGKVYCGECGELNIHCPDNRTNQVYWRCRNRMKKGVFCRGRSITETKLIQATLQAFHDVIDCLAELEDEKHECEKGTVVQTIRSKIEDLQKQEDDIRDEISGYAESGQLKGDETSDNAIVEELEKKKAELADIQDKKNRLMAEKADFDYQSVQVNSLIELIHTMQKEPSETEEVVGEDDTDDGYDLKYGSFAPEVRRQLAKYPAACSSMDDFFERTAERRNSGPITEFDNNDVIRYIDKIIVYQDRLAFLFKAGVTIEERF